MIRPLLLVTLLAPLVGCGTSMPAENPVQSEVLLRASHAWDGSAYERYPTRQPELTLLRIRIAANTTLDWHRHPAPNAGYVLSGELTVETPGIEKQITLRAGDALAEMVNLSHRGRTGNQPAELIVFYAGAEGLPLSEIELLGAKP